MTHRTAEPLLALMLLTPLVATGCAGSDGLDHLDSTNGCTADAYVVSPDDGLIVRDAPAGNAIGAIEHGGIVAVTGLGLAIANGHTWCKVAAPPPSNLFAGISATGDAFWVAEDYLAPASQGGAELLANPGFEGDVEGNYVQQCSIGNDWRAVDCATPGSHLVNESIHAPGWKIWWRTPTEGKDGPYPTTCTQVDAPNGCVPWRSPSYLDTQHPVYPGPSRSVSGDSQKFTTTFAVHDAGLYQVVAVAPGTPLTFSALMEGWSTSAGDAAHSDPTQDMRFQVGIDPTGGEDPWSAAIQWSAATESDDQFSRVMTYPVVAGDGGKVSVWIRSRPSMPLTNVDAYVDDASLQETSLGY